MKGRDVPVERLPVERLPVERLPVERLPVERLPAERLPVERLPAERLPVPPMTGGSASRTAFPVRDWERGGTRRTRRTKTQGGKSNNPKSKIQNPKSNNPKSKIQNRKMSKEFPIGGKVRVIALPPYVKTADPMPMLRPPDVIQVGSEGIVIDRRPGGYWGVRFSKGAFLLDSEYIESITDTSSTSESSENNQ